MTETLNSLQGETIEYAQDKQDNEKQIQSECSLHHIIDTSSAQGRSWPFPATFKKTTEALPLPSRNHNPRALGKVGQGDRSPEPFLGFLGFSFTQLRSIFCPWGFERNIYSRARILKFYGYTTPSPRAKECLQSLNPRRELVKVSK